MDHIDSQLICEFYNIFNKIKDKLVVEVIPARRHMPYTPTVYIKSCHEGFDWDSGKIILTTDEPIYIELEILKRKSKCLDTMASAMCVDHGKVNGREFRRILLDSKIYNFENDWKFVDKTKELQQKANEARGRDK